MRQSKDEKVMTDCLKEMFKRVGLKYPCPEFTKDKDWYMKKSWTEEEEADFKKWMTKKLKKTYPYMTAKKLEWEVGLFCLSYGWTNGVVST